LNTLPSSKGPDFGAVQPTSVTDAHPTTPKERNRKQIIISLRRVSQTGLVFFGSILGSLDTVLK
tara:strand:- start:598 stop:789 length:192 start_codon:yes stop_codon:yes gene_type:complete